MVIVVAESIIDKLLHNAPLKALYMFLNIGDGATSDLYFVIILSIVIVYACYIVSKMTIVWGGDF